MIEGLTYILSVVVDWLGWSIALLGAALVAWFILRTIVMLFVCLWRGDPQWREHGLNIMMTSDLFAIGYLLSRHADLSADRANKRADIIDQAIAEGKDPYRALDDAGF